MRAVKFQKHEDSNYNSVMEYVAEYIQNEYHYEFAFRKWLYLNNNHKN